MATARGLKRLRAIAARMDDFEDDRVLLALVRALNSGMRRDQTALKQSTELDSDGDLILELPPCEDEQAWRERFGSAWLYYWISFGCWL